MRTRNDRVITSCSAVADDNHAERYACREPELAWLSAAPEVPAGDAQRSGNCVTPPL